MKMQLVSCARRNESTKRSCCRRQGEDMISNLPDFIIGYILSFLPTKKALLTSVLSKRWKYMWTFVTKLHFSYYPDWRISWLQNYFPEFVNSATIEEFTLRLEDLFSEYYINQWISAALDKRVKRIDVYSFSYSDHYHVNQINLSSYPLFESHSLEELVFNVMDNPCIIKLCSFVCLPCLTVLKLVGIVFTSYSSNELKELTLNLPLLREYETGNCTCWDIKSITIEAPLLELVRVMDVRSKMSEIIKFCGSHIKKFSYSSGISSQTILLDDQHISSANLRIYHYNAKSVEQIWIYLRKLIRLFVNAEHLDLTLPNDQIKSLAVEHYLAGMPAFQMLRYLRLDKVTSDVLLAFLLKSPCLKTLDLEMAYYDEAEWQDFTIVPGCFVSTLKVVKFDKYFHSECELSFVKFVIENAKVLERISFSFDVRFDSFSKGARAKNAKEKLSCLVKNSFNTVIMEFEYDDDWWPL